MHKILPTRPFNLIYNLLKQVLQLFFLVYRRVGHSLDKVVDIGAVVSEDQRKAIVEYVESAKEEGADVFQVIIYGWLLCFVAKSHNKVTHCPSIRA